MVGVAQLVEPRVVIPVVVGSSPIVHPMSNVEYYVSLYIVFFLFDNSLLLCESGGIGRRAGFRFQ